MHKIIETFWPMPDGVKLYTRITLPCGAQKAPIVFIRTPYENAHNGQAHDPAVKNDYDVFVEHGYAVVFQHCRGRGDSEGVCVPYEEREDGLCSLAIIRTLDIYNGEIYLYGGSYLSTVHLTYLDTEPADIKGAVLNIQTDRMYFRNYRNGCCYDFCNYKWWLKMISRAYPKKALDGAVRRPYKNLMRNILGTDFPPFTDTLLHDTYDSYWRDDPRTDVIQHLKMPVLFVEGWYDFYIEGMLCMWERLPEKTKARSAMIVGPWGHATHVSSKAQYPLPGGNIPPDYAAQWFDSIRKGTAYPYAETGKIRYYSIGCDTWKTAVSPQCAGDTLRLYFDTDRTLKEAPAQTEESISYRYDPEKRAGCFPYGNIFQAAEKGSVEGVISFETQPFEREMRFFGPLRWRMRVKSDCEDTAFFIRVYFVEKGAAYNLTQTICALSSQKADYKAGDEITLDLCTPSIAFAVKAGGKIRVDIASDGGVYVPHANVRGHWAEVTESRVAENTIFVKDAFIELGVDT